MTVAKVKYKIVMSKKVKQTKLMNNNSVKMIINKNESKFQYLS